MMDDSPTTLADCLGTMPNPERYLRKVLENAVRTYRKHGSATVRIGATGKGIAPNYVVEPDLPEFGGELHAIAFNGRSHQEMAKDDSDAGPRNWNYERLSVQEVQKLYQLVKSGNYKKSPPA